MSFLVIPKSLKNKKKIGRGSFKSINKPLKEAQCPQPKLGPRPKVTKVKKKVNFYILNHTYP